MPAKTNNLFPRVVDAVISVAILGAVFVLGYSASIADGDHGIFLEASFFFALSALFWLSYFRTKWLFLFEGIAWIFGTWSFPQKKYMTVVYSLAFFCYGGWLFYRWLFAG